MRRSTVESIGWTDGRDGKGRTVADGFAADKDEREGDVEHA
jgi:hypothetical protein